MPYPCVVGCIKPRCDGLACYTHAAPVAPPTPRAPDGGSVPLTEWSTDALASFLSAFEENCPPVVRGPIREAVARLRTIAPLTPEVVAAARRINPTKLWQAANLLDSLGAGRVYTDRAALREYGGAVHEAVEALKPLLAALARLPGGTEVG